ncbi:acyltransferase domain-containing protein [Lacticaseibacillus kribbianus]|uniref:acyltransferase domain-containing protein n=1 Tax=Lacticaseibacillus kribbianus TaxID=2926292 RepID=UPI001CD7C756|nr:acyltransferase domain-containing protein [Lacticaseibacillus kribbianus]
MSGATDDRRTPKLTAREPEPAGQGTAGRPAMTLAALAAGIGLPTSVLEAADRALAAQVIAWPEAARTAGEDASVTAAGTTTVTAAITAAGATAAGSADRDGATDTAGDAATAPAADTTAPAAALAAVDWPRLYAEMLLQDTDAAFHAWQAARVPNPDATGLATLGLQLHLAVQAHARYQALGLPDATFLATMGYFSRTVRESTAESRRSGFLVRDWSRRQLQLREFRLGSFEYERVGDDINLHIPGDADLTTPARLESYRAARQFWPQHFGLTVTALHCGSWLLAPVLDEVLKPDSRLRQFRGDFRMTGSDPTENGYRKWLFDNDQGPAEGLATRTSLQRGVRDLVLAGKPIGVGIGVIDLASVLGETDVTH